MDIRETKTVRLKLTELHDNHGQIQGVPANPRFVRDKQYKRLLKSLREGDLTGVMPIKVFQYDGEWVVIGGNMRLRAMQELKIADVSCIVIPAGTNTETICKIAMIDNSTFGEWDFDMLANEWSELPLEDWGLEVPSGWGKQETESEEQPSDYAPRYIVEIECADEQKQQSLYERLIQEGYECRVLTL